MDAMDMVAWGSFVAALGLAAFGLDELYEWFVEPSRHHTPEPVPQPSAPYSVRSFPRAG